MKKTTIAATVILLSVLIALASTLYKGQKAPSCRYDGTRITPIYEVDIILRDGRVWRFCSVYCARAMFKEHRGQVETVLVTDEVTGDKIASSVAYFVESDIVTNRVTRNRVHVFKDETQALSHAEKHNGRRIDDPFM